MLLSSTRRIRARAVVAGAVVAVTAVAAAPASAGTPVELAPAGGTTLRLDAGVAKALKGLGVSVAPTGRAKAGAGGVTFPITAGRIDPASAAGYIKHAGGLRLSAGKVKVTLSDYNVVVGGRTTLSAKVNGGARAQLLVPGLTAAKITRPGLGTTVSGVALTLSKAGARALNSIFHVKAFKTGLKLGTLTIKAQPAEVAFAGGRTDLALDAGAAAALDSLKIKAGVIDGAVANADGSLGFPITGGLVNATSLAGAVTHSGGISLKQNNTTVALTGFTIDTVAKTLSAKVNGAGPVAILALDLSAPKVAISGRAVTVANVPARLTKAAADALNQAFSTSAFTEGLLLGVATVRGQAA